MQKIPIALQWSDRERILNGKKISDLFHVFLRRKKVYSCKSLIKNDVGTNCKNPQCDCGFYAVVSRIFTITKKMPVFLGGTIHTHAQLTGQAGCACE